MEQKIKWVKPILIVLSTLETAAQKPLAGNDGTSFIS
jgi:hypothetical protein